MAALNDEYMTKVFFDNVIVKGDLYNVLLTCMLLELK